MSVELDPPELGFKRPFNREICQVLHIENKNPDPVVFKVKTTAPKHYCVRPNSGRIEPGKHMDVQVLLQAMKQEPPSNAKCKDKFLVQSVAVTGDMEYSNVSAIFEKVSKASIQERKIRVNYLDADPNEVLEESTHANGVAASEEEPPSYSSLNGTVEETPASKASEKLIDTTSSTSPLDVSEKSKREPSSPLSASDASAASLKSPSTGPTTNADVEQLKAQLADAQAQIQKLKEKLSDQGLRQRKVGEDITSTPTQLQTQQVPPEAGVPVQFVASLCLISFLLAYFFF